MNYLPQQYATYVHSNSTDHRTEAAFFAYLCVTVRIIKGKGLLRSHCQRIHHLDSCEAATLSSTSGVVVPFPSYWLVTESLARDTLKFGAFGSSEAGPASSRQLIRLPSPELWLRGQPAESAPFQQLPLELSRPGY